MKKQLKRNKLQRFINWINLRYVTVIMITMILTTLMGDFNDRYILQVPIEWKGFTRERFVSPVPKTFDSKHVIDPKNPEPGIKNVTPSPTPTPKRKAATIDVVRAVEASELVTHMSDEEIITYIESKDWDSAVAVPLAKSENFWNLTKSFNCGRKGKINSDGSQDYGIFQINTIHTRTLASKGMTMEDMLDCKKNIDFAFEHVYTTRGNWSAWAAFNNGSYLNHIN